MCSVGAWGPPIPTRLMICTFVGCVCMHFWRWVCTFHVKIEPLHIWGRHVCTLVVDVFLQICTFVGAVFAQIGLFAHLRAKVCTNVVVCTIVVFCTFDGSTYLHPTHLITILILKSSFDHTVIIVWKYGSYTEYFKNVTHCRREPDYSQ